MDMSEAQAWVVITGVISTGLIGIINAMKAHNIQEIQKRVIENVDKVHVLVNSTAEKQRLEIETLRSLLAAKQLEASMAESTRTTLAAEHAEQQRILLVTQNPQPPPPVEDDPKIVKP